MGENSWKNNCVDMLRKQYFVNCVSTACSKFLENYFVIV